MKKLLLLLLLSTYLFAERGIVVSTNDRYTKKYLYASLVYLRDHLRCTLPIEIWHDGDELSEKMKEKLGRIFNVTFCNFEEVFKGAYGSLRGWHSKPYMLLGTRFDEVCLMDADVFFFKDPETLFHHEKYLLTGTFFFRDRWNDFPQGETYFTQKEFLEKRALYRTLIPHPSQYVPRSCLHIWYNDQIPTIAKPQPIDCQEGGCLYINKSMHREGVQKVVDLATYRSTNRVYDILYGDKETYWVSFELCEEPYAFNDLLASGLRSHTSIHIMVQFVDGELFFQQKEPVQVFNQVEFFGKNEFTGKEWHRFATARDVEILRSAYSSYIKNKGGE